MSCTWEQYLLLLEEQQSLSISAESLYLLGLSKREAEVLFWTAQDKNNPHIALILDISSRIVNKDLEAIAFQQATASQQPLQGG